MTEPAEPSERPEPAAPVDEAEQSEPVTVAARRVRQPPWALVVAGLAGLAVGALAIGGAWLTTGSVAAVDTRAVTLPDRIGSDYVPLDQTELQKKPNAAYSVGKMRERWDRSSQRLSESYRGAGAIIRMYSDQSLERLLEVRVFRARSPHPQFVPYIDPADLGRAKPEMSAETFDQVSCKVHNMPTEMDTTPAPDSARAVACSRTSDELTVEITPGPSHDFRPHDVAAMVDQIWNAVG